jgi:hypothetical protein
MAISPSFGTSSEDFGGCKLRKLLDDEP